MRKWAPAAAIVAACICSLPGECSASVSYGLQTSHQQNEVDNGITSSSTTQDRFGFYFNILAAPASRLNMTGIFKFDVLLSKNNGSDSTEYQPNTDIRFSARSVQSGFGYREIITDQTILSGVNEQNQHTDDKEGYAEASINPARLPSVRLRYSLRDQKQSNDGDQVLNTLTNDFTAGMNYRIGIFAMNADVRYQNIKDRIAGTTSDNTQATGQVSAAKVFGPRFDASLRENYIINLANQNQVQTGNSYSSISEARANFRPFVGMAASTNYIYRIANDLFAQTGKQNENTWFSSVNYNFTPAIRVYGSYNLHQEDDQLGSTRDNIGIWGVALNRVFGRFSVSARYEGQGQSTSSSTNTAIENVENTDLRTNVDWSVAARLVRFVALNLGESYVSDTTNSLTTSSNRFRLSANIIPVSYFTMAPSVDYTINTNPDGTHADTTQIAVPAAFRMTLHQKLDFSATDDYRWSQNVDVVGSVSTSSSNNLVLRLTLNQPLPGTVMAADATFQSNSTGNDKSTTSTYTARLSWAAGMQALSANAQYQTGTANGTDTVSSGNFSAQYGVRFSLKKLLFSLQARYDYTVTFSTPQNTGQTVFLSLDVRR